MKQFSSLSSREEFALNGTLSAETIEQLLDVADDYAAWEDKLPLLQDAICQYPVEDCLSDISWQLRCLAELLKGERKAHVERIMEEVRAKERELYHSAEEGIACLEGFQCTR